MKKPIILTITIFDPEEFEVANMLLARAIELCKNYPEKAWGLTKNQIIKADKFKSKALESFLNPE